MKYSSTDIINENVILFVVIIVATKMICNFLILIYLLEYILILMYLLEIVLKIFKIIYTCMCSHMDNISLDDNSNINQPATVMKNNYCGLSVSSGNKIFSTGKNLR